MNWQPISSAPKDRWILLRGGRDDAIDIEYLDPSEAAPAVVGKFTGYGCYKYAFWDSEWRSSYLNPTEWMDIPD